MTNSNKEHVRKIIAQTFEVIKKVYDTQKEKFGNSSESCESGSRIIFPKYSGRYRNGETRISEQELRFIFVEQFNKYCKITRGMLIILWKPQQKRNIFLVKRGIKIVHTKLMEKEMGDSLL